MAPYLFKVNKSDMKDYSGSMWRMIWIEVRLDSKDNFQGCYNHAHIHARTHSQVPKCPPWVCGK